MEKDLQLLIRRFLEHLEIEKNCSKLTIRNYEHYLNVLFKFLIIFIFKKMAFISRLTNPVEIPSLG